MQMSSPDRDKLLPLLARARDGDLSATESLLPLVYNELRSVAGKLFRGERGDHTLQPTALVHEAFVKMIGTAKEYDGRRHFMAIAAKAMRQVLADHARARRSAKRGGQFHRIDLAVSDSTSSSSSTDLNRDVEVVALDDALTELEKRHARAAEVVELRFFAGFTVEEVIETLDVSRSTVEADWRAARAWLRSRLAEHEFEAEA